MNFSQRVYPEICSNVESSMLGSKQTTALQTEAKVYKRTYVTQQCLRALMSKSGL